MRNASQTRQPFSDDSLRSSGVHPNRDSEGSVVEAPRWLFLGALIFAPWAYGSTREWAILGLCSYLGVVALLWLAACLLQRRRPAIPRLLAIPAIALVGLGWFMVGNARYDYDPANLEFTPLHQILPFAPGSLHRSLSFAGAMQSTAMLVSLCLVCDMTRRSIWRKRLLWTIAITGLSIVLLGLAQRFTEATAIFWGNEEMGQSFFGTYRYHSNAGAFLNLVWPVMAGFAAISFLKASSGWRKSCWLAALTLSLAGAVVIASRAAAAVTAILALIWAAWVLREVGRGRWRGINLSTAVVAGFLIVLLVGSLSAFAGLDVSMKRWGKFEREITEKNPRLLTAQVCLKMLPEAGLWGFGPGTFQTAFPYFTHQLDNEIAGRWIYTHQDYLQTLIEWGYVGTAGWAVIVFGGLAAAAARLRRRQHELSVAARLTHLVLTTSLAGVLIHALVDFPLQIASIQLYACTLLGMLWSSRRWLQPARQWKARAGSAAPVREIAVAA